MHGLHRLGFGVGSGVCAAVAAVAWSATALTALPQNSCDLLSVPQVATAAGVEIRPSNRLR
jgi:hypothetical protein